MNSLGIDIGGTSIKAALRTNGQWAWTGQSQLYSRPSTENLREAILQATAGRVKTVDTIGLCVPGLLDMNRRVVELAVSVPGLVEISLDRLVPDTLKLKFDRHVRILNDASATAYDIFRAHQLTGRLLVMALGTGVGAAVLDDGTLLKVEGQSPGHLGQLDVSIAGDEVVGPDGGAGGFEGYIGVAALAKRYGPDFTNALKNFTGKESAIRALVRALRIGHVLYRPHHIFLSGGIAMQLKYLLPEINRQVAEKISSVARPGVAIRVGDDVFHAARGAALLAEKE